MEIPAQLADNIACSRDSGASSAKPRNVCITELGAGHARSGTCLRDLGLNPAVTCSGAGRLNELVAGVPQLYRELRRGHAHDAQSSPATGRRQTAAMRERTHLLE